jgi:hypothetical protein
MYEALFIVPLCILFFILIYHSLKTNGKRTTLLFFGIALIFAFLRELIIGLTYPLYFSNFKIGPIPPAIMLGWVFAFYLGDYFARKITADTRFANNIFVKICLGTFVVLGISLIMETTAPLLGWWWFQEGLLESLPPAAIVLGAPLFVLIGWSTTGATFLGIYYLLQQYNYQLKVILLSSILYSAIIINFVMCNYIILYHPPLPFPY